MKDSVLVTLGSMFCITLLAAIYDGQLLYIAVGALVGLLAPSPLQLTAKDERPSEPPETATTGG